MAGTRIKFTAAVILIIMALFAHEMFFDFTSDDAFISFRYAGNFLQGHGLVYNVGERVEGYTNFLWVMLLSLFASLRLDVVFVSRFLGALTSAAILVVVFRFGRRYSSVMSHGLIAPLLLSLNAAFAVWSVSGMETALFTLVAILGIFGTVRERDRGNPYPFSSIWFALAALTRPEGVFLFAGNAFCPWFLGWREARGKAFARWFLLSIATFGAVYVPYYVWRWSYYGFPLPNTFYAKTGGGFHQYLRGSFYVFKFVTTFGGFVLFLLPAAVMLRQRIPFWIKLLFFHCFLWLGYVVWVGGDGLVCSRFLVPILPMAYLLIQEGMGVLAERLGAAAAKPKLVGRLLVAGVVMGTLSPTVNVRRDPYTEVVKEREMVRNLAEIGRWLKNNAGPDAVIATNVAGALPYYAGLRTIDMLGLNDLHIAHRKIIGMGRGSAGHEKKDVEYVMGRKPTYVMEGWPTPRKVEKNDTVRHGETVYRFVSLKVGRGRFFEDFSLKEGELWFNALARVED